jgi:hypothetical protein
MCIVSQLRTVTGRSALVIACALAGSAPALAQVEASIEFGYTASEGIKASEQRLVLGQLYQNLDVTSGGSWGFTVGAFVTPNIELEFLYHRQFSSLEISDPAPDLKLANQNVDNYHGNFVYNFGEPDAKIRAFALFGLGATHYGPGDYDPGIPNSGSISKIASLTKFSSTWGGGVKAYPSPHIGVKGTLRWTPTYIKSDPGGVWCDPFYPTCWVIGDPDYSHQFEFSGGVTFRFGGF